MLKKGKFIDIVPIHNSRWRFKWPYEGCKEEEDVHKYKIGRDEVEVNILQFVDVLRKYKEKCGVIKKYFEKFWDGFRMKH